MAPTVSTRPTRVRTNALQERALSTIPPRLVSTCRRSRAVMTTVRYVSFTDKVIYKLINIGDLPNCVDRMAVCGSRIDLPVTAGWRAVIFMPQYKIKCVLTF